MDQRYTREDYEHRNCLAVTRTESGEFVKCMVHTGNPDDVQIEESPIFNRLDDKPDSPDKCSQCGVHVTHVRFDDVHIAADAPIICDACITNVDLAPVRIDNVIGEIR